MGLWGLEGNLGGFLMETPLKNKGGESDEEEQRNVNLCEESPLEPQTW